MTDRTGLCRKIRKIIKVAEASEHIAAFSSHMPAKGAVCKVVVRHLMTGITDRGCRRIDPCTQAISIVGLHSVPDNSKAFSRINREFVAVIDMAGRAIEDGVGIRHVIITVIATAIKLVTLFPDTMDCMQDVHEVNGALHNATRLIAT